MTEEYDKMLEKIKAFVVAKLGVPYVELTEKTKVEEDVGIGGLDSWTFYEDFFKDFGIINPEDFDADKYIASEGIEFWKFIESIFSKSKREELKSKNVTLGHLANVALQKKWFEE